MKKLVYIFCFCIVAIGFSSCGIDTVNTDNSSNGSSGLTAAQQAAADDTAIQAYLTANKITATKDASGLYYQVITQGTGAAPLPSSTVKVTYTGKLLNGIVFEQTRSPVSLPLAQLILGWQIGLQYVNSGGNILLIIPSGLAYGTTNTTSVPANSVVIYNISLLDVQ